MQNENCLLYDWFTCSFKVLDFTVLQQFLGFHGRTWCLSDRGSKLRYGNRLECGGISIHYTDTNDIKHELGCCLEMSGQGCREFETYGNGDWDSLVRFCLNVGGSITRVDIAYDDFTGVLPLDVIADMAARYQFTAISKHLRITHESIDADPQHMGISVCHGSKCSAIYIRLYDKRVERQKWDVPHWVRCEVQLRKDNAKGFLTAAGDLGVRFCGVLAHYLCYRCAGSDSNYSRHAVAPFWAAFLRSASALSVNSRKDVEYNKSRLEQHIYDRNHRAIKTAILSDGLPEFLRKTFEESGELPDKYKHILTASENSAAIIDLLNKPHGQQLRQLSQQLDELQGIV